MALFRRSSDHSDDGAGFGATEVVEIANALGIDLHRWYAERHGVPQQLTAELQFDDLQRVTTVAGPEADGTPFLADAALIESLNTIARPLAAAPSSYHLTRLHIAIADGRLNTRIGYRRDEPEPIVLPEAAAFATPQEQPVAFGDNFDKLLSGDAAPAPTPAADAWAAPVAPASIPAEVTDAGVQQFPTYDTSAEPAAPAWGAPQPAAEQPAAAPAWDAPAAAPAPAWGAPVAEPAPEAPQPTWGAPAPAADDAPAWPAPSPAWGAPQPETPAAWGAPATEPAAEPAAAEPTSDEPTAEPAPWETPAAAWGAPVEPAAAVPAQAEPAPAAEASLPWETPSAETAASDAWTPPWATDAHASADAPLPWETSAAAAPSEPVEAAESTGETADGASETPWLSEPAAWEAPAAETEAPAAPLPWETPAASPAAEWAAPTQAPEWTAPAWDAPAETAAPVETPTWDAPATPSWSAPEPEAAAPEAVAPETPAQDTPAEDTPAAEQPAWEPAAWEPTAWQPTEAETAAAAEAGQTPPTTADDDPFVRALFGDAVADATPSPWDAPQPAAEAPSVDVAPVDAAPIPEVAAEPAALVEPTVYGEPEPTAAPALPYYGETPDYSAPAPEPAALPWETPAEPEWPTPTAEPVAEPALPWETAAAEPEPTQPEPAQPDYGFAVTPTVPTAPAEPVIPEPAFAAPVVPEPAPAAAAPAAPEPAPASGAPLLRFDQLEVGPDDLAAQLPLTGELLYPIPGPDRPDYCLVLLPEPLTFVLPEGFDVARFDPQFVSRNAEGAIVAQIPLLVIAARFEGTQIAPDLKDLWVNVGYVVDNSVSQDAELDFAKIHYAAIARVNLVG